MPLWKTQPYVAIGVIAVAVSAIIRGLAYLLIPNAVTVSHDFDEVRRVDPGFVGWGTLWLTLGVVVLILVTVGHRLPVPAMALPWALIVFVAAEGGWAVMFLIAALRRHPFGSGTDGADNYILVALACGLLARWVIKAIAEHEALERAGLPPKAD